MQDIEFILDRLSKSKFRSSFHLKQKDKEYVQKLGIEKIKSHAYDFVHKRLAIKEPLNDGKQTPMKGHPVFIAQHATATCCRSCLNKWHKIPMRKELNNYEVDYIVNVIIKYIQNEMGQNS